eukprot:148749_1
MHPDDEYDMYPEDEYDMHPDDEYDMYPEDEYDMHPDDEYEHYMKYMEKNVSKRARKLCIREYNQYHTFNNYVNYIEQGIQLMALNDGSIYMVHEITVIICDYIYDGFNPPMNLYRYRFGYEPSDFNHQTEYKKERIEYINLPSFKDFLHFIVFSDLNTCCPYFKDCAGWGSLGGAIGDWAFIRGKKANLNIKKDEFMAQKLETYKKRRDNFAYDDIVQMVQLIDLNTNENIVKMTLCELYHYSDINMGFAGPCHAFDMIKHSLVGKVKYNDNFAYIYIEIYSEHYKWASLTNRILRKNWIDLCQILQSDIRLDCYSFLNPLNSFDNMDEVAKYNEEVAKYNEEVAKYNEEVAKYNEEVAKYN